MTSYKLSSEETDVSQVVPTCLFQTPLEGHRRYDQLDRTAISCNVWLRHGETNVVFMFVLKRVTHHYILDRPICQGVLLFHTRHIRAMIIRDRLYLVGGLQDERRTVGSVENLLGCHSEGSGGCRTPGYQTRGISSVFFITLFLLTGAPVSVILVSSRSLILAYTMFPFFSET